MDETKFGAEYDSRFFEELAWYAKTDLENDRLEGVDLRATTALGLKYSWLDNQSYKISVRAGRHPALKNFDLQVMISPNPLSIWVWNIGIASEILWLGRAI